MKNYFDEPELKKSSIIISALAFIVLLSCLFLINSDYKRVKSEYTKSSMAILGMIAKDHPELTAEIVPVITKGPDEAFAESGKALLSAYGYNENIEIPLVPGMSKSYDTLLFSIMSLLFLAFLFIFTINSMGYSKTYKKLEQLTLAAQNISDFNFDIGIYKNSEGVFAKLSNAFSNMRIIMKNNYHEIQREKNFLSDTLSDISHQLKTPIASLVIYNDILLNRKIDDEKRIEFLENSKNQLNRIEWLVKSLLQLAKLDAGVIEFDKKASDLNITVEEAVMSLYAKSEQMGVKLTFSSIDKDVIFSHDSNWLCEALINIIKNALEHSFEGGTVQVNTESSPACTRIIIKDNGSGIPREELPNIFKRFYKGKENKNTESVGIGLALSKSIIESHGGVIGVKSKPGDGTVFTISFLKYI